MIQILAYGGKNEMQSLRDMLIHLSVQYEKLEYKLKIFTTVKAWEKATAKMDLIDLVICDVSDPQAVEMLVRARKNYREAKIIPIADEHILPSVYVRPDISPCTLLWRPLKTEKNRKALLQILQTFVVSNEEERVFYITTRQKTQTVPYGKILYFEAREKRVYVRTEFQEIGFHGTLSGLEKELQDAFIRCHKGYLVNRDKIRSVDWSQHLVQVGEDCILPISRNYQSRLREAYHERSNG
ncbi:MAG: LytTR family DNA-binding domain-containing protein [Oliverpabstia intestinalis]|jgi:DNA-binding LytR/AlgR family response regulator|uniref:LytR/AlgR family response regulator transcription factor n=1 Tax=Oliverpabstia intestinalis TaxID=2606633 RepID=UPI002A91265A|nr:LytTR family DNA-binding domain-containing protein [Oliverpabstia intestinalis]MDY5791763.1 LytTR family DNA-binding domain-containing protein [Oliverpabstia intestinalis]